MMGEGAYRKFMKIREKHGCKTGLKTAYWARISRNPESFTGHSQREDFRKCLSRKAFISRKPFVFLFTETGREGYPWPAYIRLHKPVRLCDWRGEAFVKAE